MVVQLGESGSSLWGLVLEVSQHHVQSLLFEAYLGTQQLQALWRLLMLGF